MQLVITAQGDYARGGGLTLALLEEGSRGPGKSLSTSADRSLLPSCTSPSHPSATSPILKARQGNRPLSCASYDLLGRHWTKFHQPAA